MERYSPDDIRDLILLNESISWTPDLMDSLRTDNKAIKRILRGDAGDLQTFFRGHKSKMSNFRTFIDSLDEGAVDATIRTMVEGGISVITLFDDDYPSILRNIPDPPLVLYHIGTFFDMSRCVAISGTRDPARTVYDKSFEVARALAEKRYTVTSGLAIGIDTSAHEGALSIGDAATVAVMANGLDRIIPRSNLALAKEIASRGAVLSEKSLRPEPSRYDFIRRNRIISGISRVQIIMQSFGKGGTEHQFVLASGQGRPVLVYIGKDLPSDSKRSAASMVKKGAQGFETVDEVLDLVDERFKEVIPPAGGKDIPLERWY